MSRPETWEEAVRWYRDQPGNEEAVRNNYFDLPVTQATERYAASEEFAEVVRLLGHGNDRSILDLGAGNGIASIALATHGWRVSALEPDPSHEVGAAAISQAASDLDLPIEVVEEWGEKLPFSDAQFDAVHGRQVLHHANDLDVMVAEVARVVKPGGLMLFTREHVVDDDGQLSTFLENHPLQHLYGGEHAYSTERYLEAFVRAGLEVKAVWGPMASILNFFPGTESDRVGAICASARRRFFGLGRLMAWSQAFVDGELRRLTETQRVPGRLFSFLLVKP